MLLFLIDVAITKIVITDSEVNEVILCLLKNCKDRVERQK